MSCLKGPEAGLHIPKIIMRSQGKSRKLKIPEVKIQDVKIRDVKIREVKIREVKIRDANNSGKPIWEVRYKQ